MVTLVTLPTGGSLFPPSDLYSTLPRCCQSGRALPTFLVSRQAAHLSEDQAYLGQCPSYGQSSAFFPAHPENLDERVDETPSAFISLVLLAEPVIAVHNR